ncbi:MAG TPA: rod shape-determining protein RodA [Gemmatimonadales bacterium]|nr:rod shape-determining protein RodA [Gemmatimonadales bacterium]
MNRTFRLDRGILLALALLLAYGVLVLYSAGQTDVPTSANGVWEKQLVWILIAGAAAFTAFRVSPRLLEWAAPPLYALGIVLLLVTLVVGTGAGTAAGTRSWLAVGGVRIGQPVELAKLATILMLARWLAGRRAAPRSLRELVPGCVIAGVPFLLVLKQPDLGSAIVFAGILFAMLFWGGTRPWLLFLLATPVFSLLLAFNVWTWGLWCVVLGLLLWWWRPFLLEGITVALVNIVMGFTALPVWRSLAPYQQNRLLTFLNPGLDPQGANYQAIQSKVAIGSGGWFGMGWLEGPQKRLVFLPAQHTDFVFSVVGEELGFLGVTLALLLFGYLLTRLIGVARRTTDPFSGLVVFGVAGLILTHVFENVGMTVSLMPITGIPLPFFSYGGSFLVASGLAMGMVLRVAADAVASGYPQR